MAFLENVENGTFDPIAYNCSALKSQQTNYNTLELFYAKNGSKKKLIFENESILKMAKNGHNAKAIAHAKYSLWVKK